MAGHWAADNSLNSTQLPLLSLGSLSITTDQSGLILARNWSDSSGTVTVKDGFTGSTTGALSQLLSRVWVHNIFVGIEYATQAPYGWQKTTVSNNSVESCALFRTAPVRASTGFGNISEQHEFLLLNGSSTLRYNVQSTGALPQNMTFFLKRVSDSKPAERAARALHPLTGSPLANLAQADGETKSTHLSGPQAALTRPKNASPKQNTFNLQLQESWELSNPAFQQNAMAISLQGLANRGGANLYLTYPEQWVYSYTPMVREFFSVQRGFSFTNLTSAAAAVAQFRDSVKGYILWNPNVRDSLIVAYTAAGVMDAVVATEGQVGQLQQLGLPLLLDLRSTFQGMSAPDVFKWAKAKFWAQTSKKYIVWLGGACAPYARPGIADWGVSQRAFFTSLSTAPPSQVPAMAAEYAVADDLVANMGPEPLLMGWHSYCKQDEEHTFVTLASKHGGRVHGLNTNPNLSFSNKVPLPSDFKFRNTHNAPLSQEQLVALQGKTVLALVQTDGLGLGAWNKKGRGAIDYAWEVTLPDLQLQPSLLQMFYQQATAKDHFVGALGGPGYMYPKAVPAALLHSRLQQAQADMHVLDLQEFVIFDASSATGEHTVTADTNLTTAVMDAYFAEGTMNATTGFLNGYAPSFSYRFDGSTKRSLVSFDYYLDPSRSVQEVVDDLQTLARANARRPYFCAVHVREWSTVGKVQEVIASLPSSDFELLPVDQFFQAANTFHTWMET